MEVLKFYPDPVLNLGCTQFEVDNWLVSEFVLNELVPVVGVKPYPLNELILMVASVCRLKPSYIFEWGTHIGKSARIFYEISRGFNLGIQIHSTDLPAGAKHQEHPKEARGRLVKKIPEIKLHIGDGLDKSLKIAQKLPPKPKLLFFLDGDHSYRSVKRELEGIIKSVPNATILVHDTFYQSSRSDYNIGPHRAIQDIFTETGSDYRQISTNTGLPGMTLLYPN